jgi:hypothetical protein
MPDLRILSPRLPYRTRARLAFERRIDQAGAWLCGHHGVWAAGILWRVCRMW